LLIFIEFDNCRLVVMVKPTQQDIAVNKKAAAKVRIALIERNWKVADLAQATGLKSETVTNVLCGLRRLSARIAIEDALGIAAWSTPEEFAARQQRAAANQTTEPK
jgi:lambda repressor-like predicted transcriptional regulator